jgi:Ca2+-binding EF-hand superfamily protein
VETVKADFRDCVVRERLDAKSFFKDHDHHNHFKVSPSKFKNILTLLKVPIDDAKVKSVTKVYGNKQGDIEYLRFLNDTSCLVYTINEPSTGMKSTYVARDVDHTGYKEVAALMDKIKEHVKRHRIRLGEFFQDHDNLRKGTLEATKFRTTLYAQNLQLTT